MLAIKSKQLIESIYILFFYFVCYSESLHALGPADRYFWFLFQTLWTAALISELAYKEKLELIITAMLSYMCAETVLIRINDTQCLLLYKYRIFPILLMLTSLLVIFNKTKRTVSLQKNVLLLASITTSIIMREGICINAFIVIFMIVIILMIKWKNLNINLSSIVPAGMVLMMLFNYCLPVRNSSYRLSAESLMNQSVIVDIDTPSD